MSVESILFFVLAAVTVVVVVHRVADRTGLPAAALLPLIGIGYALLPGPNVTLDPHLILTFVLPPLLYSAALHSSLLAIRRNLRTVVSLSVVLVLLTAMVIGFGFAWFVAGATLAAGVAVGAAVAPPDPVAASRNRPSADGTEKPPPVAAATATPRMVRAVASLSSPSP